MSRSTTKHEFLRYVIIVTRHEIRDRVHFTSAIERPLYRGVLGTYSTELEALSAAEVMARIADENRLCSPRDIDRVRRDNAKKKTIDPAASVPPSQFQEPC